jgi:hypothetical protein
MPTDTPIGLPEVTAFILEHATADDLDRIGGLVRQRHTALREQASADVRVGSIIELADLKPRYFNGLCGTVIEIDSGRGGKKAATLRLDKKSVTSLALASDKYAHILGQDSHDLKGIPLLCCRPATD